MPILPKSWFLHLSDRLALVCFYMLKYLFQLPDNNLKQNDLMKKINKTKAFIKIDSI